MFLTIHIANYPFALTHYPIDLAYYPFTLAYYLIDFGTYKLGLLLGIPNVLAILAALSELPAIIVLPIQNIGVIVLTAIAAYIFWKEKINLYGRIALTVGIGAIVLLKL